MKADRSLFGRIIVMAHKRSLKMEDTLYHPFGPLLWALPMPDGLLRKTNKAALTTILQKNMAVAEQLPGKELTELMCLIHTTRTPLRTVKDLYKVEKLGSSCKVSITGTQIMRHWRTFLSTVTNTNLITFVVYE